MVRNREIALLMVQAECLKHIPWTERAEISLFDILSTSINISQYKKYSEEEYLLLKSGVNRINNDWNKDYKVLLIHKNTTDVDKQVIDIASDIIEQEKLAQAEKIKREKELEAREKDRLAKKEIKKLERLKKQVKELEAKQKV